MRGYRKALGELVKAPSDDELLVSALCKALEAEPFLEGVKALDALRMMREILFGNAMQEPAWDSMRAYLSKMVPTLKEKPRVSLMSVALTLGTQVEDALAEAERDAAVSEERSLS